MHILYVVLTMKEMYIVHPFPTCFMHKYMFKFPVTCSKIMSFIQRRPLWDGPEQVHMQNMGST